MNIPQPEPKKTETSPSAAEVMNSVGVPKTGDTLDAASRLIKSMDDLTGEVRTLGRRQDAIFLAQRRGRRMSLALVCALMIDLPLTAGLGYFAEKANAAASRATTAFVRSQANTVAETKSCEASDEARRENVILWNFVFTAITPANAAPTVKEGITKLREEVATVYKQRNCAIPVPPNSAAN